MAISVIGAYTSGPASPQVNTAKEGGGLLVGIKSVERAPTHVALSLDCVGEVCRVLYYLDWS